MGNKNFIFQIFWQFKVNYTYKRYVEEKRDCYGKKNEYKD